MFIQTTIGLDYLYQLPVRGSYPGVPICCGVILQNVIIIKRCVKYIQVEIQCSIVTYTERVDSCITKKCGEFLDAFYPQLFSEYLGGGDSTLT